MTQTSIQRHMHEQINKDAKMQKNEESQTRWHGTSIKEAKHVITQKGELDML